MITSAPRSASCSVPHGPAPNCSTASYWPGSFGDAFQELKTVSDTEYYASDLAVAEAKNQFRQENYGNAGALFYKASEPWNAWQPGSRPEGDAEAEPARPRPVQSASRR